jgi:lipopolysaccharide assembly outer membrane protein LptD (OstA)
MNAKVLLAVVIFFSPLLFSQANPPGSSNKSTFTGTYTLRTDAKQQVQNIEVKGISVYSENGILSCRAECEVTLGSVLLKADEVDFHPNTGEAEARGNVKIKALPVKLADTRQP